MQNNKATQQLLKNLVNYTSVNNNTLITNALDEAHNFYCVANYHTAVAYTSIILYATHMLLLTDAPVAAVALTTAYCDLDELECLHKHIITL